MADDARARPPAPTPDPWAAGWDDARRRSLTRGLAATPAQRLAWLEEMLVLAHRAGALPRRRDDR
jgi:hypothetical protein